MSSYAKINVMTNIRELFNQSLLSPSPNSTNEKQCATYKKKGMFLIMKAKVEQSSTINIENNRFFTQSILFLKLWV
jgi:hypothetical protein